MFLLNNQDNSNRETSERTQQQAEQGIVVESIKKYNFIERVSNRIDQNIKFLINSMKQ